MQYSRISGLVGPRFCAKGFSSAFKRDLKPPQALTVISKRSNLTSFTTFSPARHFHSSITPKFAIDDDIQNLARAAPTPVSGEKNEDPNHPGALSKFNFSAETLRGLARKGIKSLFPVQYETYNLISAGTNVIAKARTGTGKTLGFVLPIVEKLMQQGEPSTRRRLPRVLVMAPTRELAKQTAEEFVAIAPQFETISIYGGTSYGPQQAALSRGVDIVVGTPGRIIDHITSKQLRLDDITHVVLDEADAMLKIGFQEDMEKILSAIPSSIKYQFLLFSATIPTWVKDVARTYLGTDYKTVDLVGNEAVKSSETIEHYALVCDGANREAVLADVIKVYAKGGRSIVFTETKIEASRLSSSRELQKISQALHGDISQHNREVTLAALRNNSFSCLIATDVAARGLDIPAVDLIINLQPPKDAESYIHRSGRTGRAGRRGICVTVYSARDSYTMKALERAVNIKFKRLGVPSENQLTSISPQEIRASVERVHPKVLPLFAQAANQFLESNSGDAVVAISKLMAKLTGVTTPFNPRSLLTGESRFTTVLLTSNNPTFSNNNSVEDLLREHISSFGEVAAGADPTVAVADVPTNDVETLMQKTIEGVKVEPCSNLPDLKDAIGGSAFGTTTFTEGSRGTRRSSNSRFGSSDGFGSRDRSRGGDRFGSGRFGGDRLGGDRFGSDRSGGNRLGGDRFGSDRSGGDRYGGNRLGGDSMGNRASYNSGDRNGGSSGKSESSSRMSKEDFDAHFDRLFGEA